MKQTGRRERERRLRRSSILEAAEEIFALKGFSGATMEEVSRQSEFGMSTLYKFFKSKRDLYFSIVDEKLSRLQEGLRHITEGDLPGESAIEHFVARHLQFFEDNIHFFKIYMAEKSELFHEPREELSRRTRARIASYVDYAENALRRWIAEGHLGTGDAQARALALLSTVDTYLSRWLTDGNVPCPKDRASFIVSIFRRSSDLAPIRGDS